MKNNKENIAEIIRIANDKNYIPDFMKVTDSQKSHQYYQVLAIHRETSEIVSRLDALEDKMDIIMGRLDYLCATDTEKMCMNQDGTTNLDAIYSLMGKITYEMKEMRNNAKNEK